MLTSSNSPPGPARPRNVQDWIETSLAGLTTASAKDIAEKSLNQGTLGWLPRAKNRIAGVPRLLDVISRRLREADRVTAAAALASAEEIHAYLVERLILALRRPGMWGGELGIQNLLGPLLMAERHP